MARRSTSLLLPAVLQLLLWTTLFADVGQSKVTPFIRRSCSSTLYPSLCERSLSPYSSRIVDHSHRRAAYYALLLAHARSRSALSFLPRSASSQAIRDCTDNLSDALDLLEKCLHGVTHMGSRTTMRFLSVLGDVQTWASAAITYDTSCLDGLHADRRSTGRALKAAARARVSRAVRVTSVALALLNGIDD